MVTSYKCTLDVEVDIEVPSFNSFIFDGAKPNLERFKSYFLKVIEAMLLADNPYEPNIAIACDWLLDSLLPNTIMPYPFEVRYAPIHSTYIHIYMDNCLPRAFDIP